MKYSELLLDRNWMFVMSSYSIEPHFFVIPKWKWVTEGRDDKFDYSNILFTCILLAFGSVWEAKIDFPLDCIPGIKRSWTWSHGFRAEKIKE